jgi:hypothetical protein
MCDTLFWLLMSSSRWTMMAHGSTALGVGAAARALKEEGGGGWASTRLLC